VPAHLLLHLPFRLAGPLDPTDNETSRVTGYTLRWIVCEAKKRQVAFEALFRLQSPAVSAAADNISAMGVFTFNSEGRICA
jgi:hypothetical protein